MQDTIWCFKFDVQYTCCLAKKQIFWFVLILAVVVLKLLAWVPTHQRWTPARGWGCYRGCRAALPRFTFAWLPFSILSTSPQPTMRCICFVNFALNVFLFCCHTTASSHPVSAVAGGISQIESGSKRSAWESKSSKPGIQIPLLTELGWCLVMTFSPCKFSPWSDFMIVHTGISLANLGTIKDNPATDMRLDL